MRPRARLYRDARTRWYAIALLLMLATPALAEALKFPALTGRVVDDAGILNAAATNQLNEMLAQHERTSGQQLVVVTLPSLQGHSIEDYGYQLGREWGIGQKDKNTGALIIVAPKEHKVRVEVGYGLEGTLTDAASRVIIERDILPAFRRGDFDAGVLAGTASVLRALGDSAAESAVPQGDRNEQPMDNSQMPGWMMLLIVAGWMLFVIIRSRFGRRHTLIGRSGYGGYWGGGGGLGGGGSSGGGFSGGGGSFGGGGASGGW